MVMPKKNGIVKTYSFSQNTIEMLNYICEKDKRSQTNCIEKLIEDKFMEYRLRSDNNGR